MGQTASVASLCCLKVEQMGAMVMGGLYPAMTETNTFNTYRTIKESDEASGTEAVSTQMGWKGRPGGGPAGVQRVTVKYQVPDCGDAVVCTDFDCSDAAAYTATYGYDDTTVDECAEAKFSISLKDHKYDCEDPSVELMKGLRDATRKILRQVNNRYNELMAGGVGSSFQEAGGTADPTLTNPLELPLFSADNKPQPMGLFPVTEQYERMGKGGDKVYMIGSSAKLSAYEYARSVFSRNENGNDPNLGLNIDARRDYNFNAAAIAAGAPAGGDYIATWLAGAIKPLEYFEFETNHTAHTADGRAIWSPIQNSGSIVRQKIDLGTIFFGIPLVVDMQIRYDECVVGGAVHYHIKKHFDLWKIPQEAFNTTCDQFHNYCLLWNVVCRDVACADF